MPFGKLETRNIDISAIYGRYSGCTIRETYLDRGDNITDPLSRGLLHDSGGARPTKYRRPPVYN